jgi:inhibitor of cysteine peptidase
MVHHLEVLVVIDYAGPGHDPGNMGELRTLLLQALISPAFHTAIMDHRIIALIILLMGVIFMTGCTNPKESAVPETKTAEPITTREPGIGVKPDTTRPGSADVTPQVQETTSGMAEGMQTGSHKTIPLNDTIFISLKENPTTGYAWNATISAGLMIENESYVADQVQPVIVGSGGMHYWLVRGIERGDQTFEAIYKRSWEPLTGDELRFSMDITII